MSEVTHVDHHNFEIRLDLKPGVAPGEIRFSDLHRLCDALQELNTRISRLVISQAGPGRTADPAARVAELRLVAVRSGSTRLGVGFGDLNTLPAPEFSLVEDECYSKFREIMQSIPEQICPSWITPLIAESAIQVVEAFDRAAFGVTIQAVQGWRTEIVPSITSRQPWQAVANAAKSDQPIAVTGLLYSVNLETRRFAIRDDVGNTIGLEEVQNVDAANDLIGKRAVASGLAARGSDGGLRAVRRAIIEARATPRSWIDRENRGSLAAELRKPGPDPRGVEGVTAEDVDEFLAILHG